MNIEKTERQIDKKKNQKATKTKQKKTEADEIASKLHWPTKWKTNRILLVVEYSTEMSQLNVLFPINIETVNSSNLVSEYGQ